MPIWEQACARDIEGAKRARFYQGVGRLLRGFMAWEQDNLRPFGPDEALTLEQARENYGNEMAWKGPVYEP